MRPIVLLISLFFTSFCFSQNINQFDENGKVKRGYRGMGWDGEGDAEGPGEIVQGISGEAVRIIKKPGAYFVQLA